MRNSQYRMAVVKITEELKNSEKADVLEKIVESCGGWEPYVRGCVDAKATNDVAGFKRNARDAMMNGFDAQIELPGLAHATLPAGVFRKVDEEEFYIPWHQATLDEQDAEVRALERRHAVQGRILDGYRATISRLRELDVPGETLGAEIVEMFPPALES